MDKIKKAIQEHWTKNAPGLALALEKYNPGQREFYLEIDNYRYKYDSYIVPLIDSFAQKDKLVLEIGCGMGTDTRCISVHGSRIVSLDLCYNNVFLTLKGMRLLGLSGQGTNADAERLPFKDNTFDVVYSFGVLHHTPNTKGAISEIHRVLRPKGRCVVMLYHKGYAYYILLLLHGYKKLLGIYNQDELMSRYDSTPLSKMYSKREIAGIFKGFRNQDISITAYGGIQTHPVLKYIYKLFYRNKFLMRRFGSFCIIKAEK